MLEPGLAHSFNARENLGILLLHLGLVAWRCMKNSAFRISTCCWMEANSRLPRARVYVRRPCPTNCNVLTRRLAAQFAGLRVTPLGRVPGEHLSSKWSPTSQNERAKVKRGTTRECQDESRCTDSTSGSQRGDSHLWEGTLATTRQGAQGSTRKSE